MPTNYLTQSNQDKAANLLTNGQDFAEIENGLLLVVAYDRTVWVCQPTGVNLTDCKMVQRVL